MTMLEPAMKAKAARVGRPKHLSPLLPPAKYDDTVKLGAMLTVQELERRAFLWAELHGIRGPDVYVFIPLSEIPNAVRTIWPQLESFAGQLNVVRRHNSDSTAMEQNRLKGIYAPELVSLWLSYKDAAAGTRADDHRASILGQMKERRRYLRRLICEATATLLSDQMPGEIKDLIVISMRGTRDDLKKLACPNSHHGHDCETVEAVAEQRRQNLENEVEIIRQVDAQQENSSQK